MNDVFVKETEYVLMLHVFLIMCTNDTTCKLYIGSNYCGIYCSTGEDIVELVINYNL